MISGAPIAQFAIIVATVLGLWIGARALVDSTVRIARRFGVSELTIGLTIVAIGTSTPELVVSVDAALAGLGEIGVGNVVGSNAYNLAFILGAVSLLRVIPVERSLVHRDGGALVLSTLVGFWVLFDRTMTRVEGALLVAAFVAYTAYVVRDERTAHSIETEYADSRVTGAIPARFSHRARDALLLAGGLALVLSSGHYMVEAASTLARGAGVSDWAIGGTIVAAGTSTPELAVSLVAMRQGHVGMSVGNVVGSNVFNMLGILGIASLLRPLAVGGAAIETLAWLTVLTVVMVAALWSGRRLSRSEGVLFVCSELARWTLGLLRIFG
ncbi:cation:H+ antiporter [Halorubrum trapanicum]|uniref:Cation:H+ antiporter n=1 Tax=Halorubrum trapanicum TaxID=29284 RepID=A0A8J7RU61_9EURY|nr:calcium/sodium antiporter [Halorubrum trapanicum]MBP1901030.1 cation:H+ antiporter [Halorubrum trapanicum]